MEYKGIKLIDKVVQGSVKDGTFNFSMIVEYRNKKYAIGFTSYPDYFKDYMRLLPDNLRFLQSNVKASEIFIGRLKDFIRTQEFKYTDVDQTIKK